MKSIKSWQVKRKIQKSIKATFGGLSSKLESSLLGSLLPDYHIRFESHIHFGHFLDQLARGNDHLISRLYCMVLQDLIEADIQSVDAGKCWCFRLCSFNAANELEILYSFVMAESISIKLSFSSFFFPCHAGSSFLRLFVSVVFK